MDFGRVRSIKKLVSSLGRGRTPCRLQRYSQIQVVLNLVYET